MDKKNKYSDEIKQEVCKAISETARGLMWLCDKNKHFPSYHTIRGWIADKESSDFRDMYMQAKREQADFMVEEMIDLADDCHADKTGQVNKPKLQIETRKFIAAKLLPKVYGDRIFNGKMDKEGEPIDDVPQLDLSKLDADQLKLFREFCLIADVKK